MMTSRSSKTFIMFLHVFAFSLIVAENANNSGDCNYINIDNVYPIGVCAEGWIHSLSIGSVMYKCNSKNSVTKYSYGTINCIGSANEFSYSPLDYDYNCQGTKKCKTANYTLQCDESYLHYVLYVMDKCSSTNTMASCRAFNTGEMNTYDENNCAGEYEEISPLSHHPWCNESWECTSDDPVKYVIYIGVPLLIFCCCMICATKAYYQFRKKKVATADIQLSLLSNPYDEGDITITTTSVMKEPDKHRYFLLVQGYIHAAEETFSIRQGIADVICDICYRFYYPALEKFAECHPSLIVSNNGFTVNSPNNKKYGTILFGEMIKNGFCAIEIKFDRLDNTSGLCIIGEQFETWSGGNKYEDWIMIPSFRVRFTDTGFICGLDATAMSGTKEFGFSENDVVCIMLDMANNVCEFRNKTQKQYKRFVLYKQQCGIAIYCINSEFTLIKQIFDAKQYKNGEWKRLLLIAGYIKETNLKCQMNITDDIQRMIYYFITG